MSAAAITFDCPLCGRTCKVRWQSKTHSGTLGAEDIESAYGGGNSGELATVSCVIGTVTAEHHAPAHSRGGR